MEEKKMKRIYIDMDGVLADYATSYKENFNKDTNVYPQSNWGFFVNLKPIKDGIETVKELMNFYDVWILTRASYKNALCYTEKRIWVERHFGLEFCQKLIICSNKSLVKGDYLIDDCVTDGQLEFEGEHIHFGKNFKNWGEVKRYLIGYKIQGKKYKNDISLEIEASDLENEEVKTNDEYRIQIKDAEDYEAYVEEVWGSGPDTSNPWYGFGDDDYDG